MNKVVQTLLALERQFKQGIRPAREPASALPKHLSTKSYSPRGTAHKLSAASSTAGSIATASVHADDIDPLDYALGAKQAQTEANQRAAIRFVEAVVGEQLPMRDMAESLRDGVILCRMMNILKPNSILSVNTGKSIPFLHVPHWSYINPGTHYTYLLDGKHLQFLAGCTCLWSQGVRNISNERLV